MPLDINHRHSERQSGSIERSALRAWIAEARAAVPVDASDGFKLRADAVISSLEDAMDRGEETT